MKRFCFSLLLLLLVAGICRAQSNYKPGTVIKSIGDTLTGFINYREWNSSPKFIEFKTTLSQKQAQRLYPAHMRGFEITGLDKYLTYIGQVSMDKNTFPDVAPALDTTIALDTLFLRFRYEGRMVSLLEQNDDVKQRYFVMEAGQSPVELKFYQFYHTNNSIRTVNAFYGPLLKLAEKYNPTSSSLVNNINRSHFSFPDLRSIVKQINNDQSKSTPLGARFFVGLMLSRINTHFDGETPFNGQSSTTYFPRVSIGADVFNNIHTQKFFMRAELSFWMTKNDFLVNPLTAYKYQFNQHTVTLTPQLVYNFYNKDALKIFLGAGAGFNFSFYSKNQVMRSDIASPGYYKFERLWMNFPLQAGVTIAKKYEVFAHYSSSVAFTKYVYLSAGNQVYGLGVHYHLGKTK